MDLLGCTLEEYNQQIIDVQSDWDLLCESINERYEDYVEDCKKEIYQKGKFYFEVESGSDSSITIK